MLDELARTVLLKNGKNLLTFYMAEREYRDFEKNLFFVKSNNDHAVR
jgi:hypothetical protein